MTTLVRWDPAAEVDSLQSEMNRLFDGFFGGRGNGSGKNGLRICHGDPAKDKRSKPASADRGRYGGRSDSGYSSDPDSGKNHRNGERRFHPPEDLTVRHPHC